MKEKLCFKIDSEWLCDFVRARVFYEGVSFNRGKEILMASFRELTEEQAIEILKGKKKVIGENGGVLTDDNKEEEYLKYRDRVRTDPENGVYDFVDGLNILPDEIKRYIPAKNFSEYGIIDPEGNFYSCGFSCHSVAAWLICKTKGIQVKEEKNFFDEVHRYDLAKDLLYDLGYIFVNLCGSEQFYSKYLGEEEYTQSQLNTVYDYNIWLKS